MNRARLQRKTVGEDPQALPGSRVYLETSGRVWHDLRFVHVSLANHGLTRQWKWYRGDLRRAWQQEELEEGLHFHLNVAPATRMTNICTSFALVMALWCHVRCSRRVQVAEACASWLRVMCLRAGETYTALAPTQSHRLLTLGENPLDVRGGLRVSGWRTLIEAQHTLTAASWTQEWSTMRRDGFVTSDWSQDEHDLVDVVHFALFYRKMRASQRRGDGVTTRRAMDALRHGLAMYLGAALDTYIVQRYLPGRQDKPPPALMSPKKTGARKYVQVQRFGICSLRPLILAPALSRSRWLEVKTRIWDVTNLVH